MPCEPGQEPRLEFEPIPLAVGVGRRWEGGRAGRRDHLKGLKALGTRVVGSETPGTVFVLCLTTLSPGLSLVSGDRERKGLGRGRMA